MFALLGLLAGGLLSGKVIIWSESDGDLASRWHIKAKITLSSPICSVQVRVTNMCGIFPFIKISILINIHTKVKSII